MQKFFTNEEIISIAWKLLNCMHYMHTEMKIAHRNVKMSNVRASSPVLDDRSQD